MAEPVLLAEQKKTSEAVKSYDQALKIRNKLVISDPSNTVWQRDLAVIYSKFANAYQLRGERDRAIEALEKGKSIIAELVAHSPGNAAWQRDLKWFEQRISELRN